MRASTIITWTAAALLAACGGSKPAAQNAGGGGGGDDGEAVEDEGEDPSMVGVERMDEIKTMLDRKRTAAAHCLSDTINHGKLDKNARGRMALSFVISPAGKATNVKVLEDSLESPDLEQCVIAKVQQIDFGALPAPLDWSYTFAFESM